MYYLLYPLAFYRPWGNNAMMGEWSQTLPYTCPPQGQTSARKHTPHVRKTIGKCFEIGLSYLGQLREGAVIAQACRNSMLQ